jgi:hypothetical protein
MLIAQALHSVVEKHKSPVYRDSRFESTEFLNKRAQVGLRSQALLVDLIEAGTATESHGGLRVQRLRPAVHRPIVQACGEAPSDASISRLTWCR